MPAITINVPAYNEERRIGRLLRSIRAQEYPQGRIEVIVADGGSSDRTVDVCKAFGCTMLHNEARDAESGKALGARHASGELHIYLDADMEWANRLCLRRLVTPWLDRDDLDGSFPRYGVDPRDPPLNRYLSRHPLYQDPLMRFLSTQIDETIVERRDGYSLCKFVPSRVPLVGIMLLRTSFVVSVLDSWGPDWAWSDVDFALALADRSSGFVAYVPSASILHRSSLTPRLHLRKLRRNVRATYLPNVNRRQATYIQWGSRRDVTRLAFWVLYANLVVPGALVGLVRAVRHRDPAMLYEAWATTVGTDYVLGQFLAAAEGRELVGRALATLVGRQVAK
jgi:glycosyltransferase involved in cell wall biosynthesis